MNALPVLPRREDFQAEPQVEVLVADDDAYVRTLVIARLQDASDRIRVIEAKDGAEAIQVGLQRHPQIAVLDLNMPCLGGIEVALTLRELRPSLRIALHTADPQAAEERAFRLGIAVFDKLKSERMVAWVKMEADLCVGDTLAPTLQALSRPLDLRCAQCGYGVATARPPARCPMCQTEDAWTGTRASATRQ
jgi:CheY-like chemotaxis protein